MAASASRRTTMVGPRPKFIPSIKFAITTPAVISTLMPMASIDDQKPPQFNPR